MSEHNLSKAVADATNFLYDIHADVRAMLVSLETAIDRAGWRPLTKKITTQNLSSTLQAEWLLWWCYRFYAPKDAGDSLTRLVAVVCSFGSDEKTELDYASLTAVAARFPKPTTFEEVYDSWISTKSVSQLALKRRGVSSLTRAEYAEFSPRASAVAAIAFPLCELTSEQMVITRLVDPLLAAEKILGAKP